jgi:tRNA dimethylallyltransferase
LQPPNSLSGHVLAVFGPTASGKSALVEAIGRRIRAEFVSADSMQVYRGLPILTNQPEVPTHLVGIWPLSHEASVGEYQNLAHETIDATLERARVPIVVGGTGLYLRAALGGLALPPPRPPEARKRWERLYDRAGAAAAHRILQSRDAPAAAAIHPNDRRRVVRALELAETGQSLRPAEDRLWAPETRHPTLIVGLEVPRDELLRRIEARTHRMFELGVEDEVRRALEGEVSTTARQMVGLREITELPQADAIDAIIVRTRQYAAYQRKWMRRVPRLVSVRADRPLDVVADEILRLVRRRQRVRAGRAGQTSRTAHS